MSTQKIEINIALISDAENLESAKAIICHFAQKEHLAVNSNSPYVLQNFDFHDAIINIIEIPTDKNQIDGFLDTHGIKQFTATISAILIPKELQGSTTPQPKKEKDTTTNAGVTVTQVYSNKLIHQLNKKLGLRRGGDSKTLILQPQKIAESPTEQEKRLNENNDAAIRETLIEIIEAEKSLRIKPSATQTQSLSKKNADATKTQTLSTEDEKTRQNSSATTSTSSAPAKNKQATIESNISNLPWYKKSAGTLVFMVLSILTSAALFNVLLFTGLLLTPWLILPFVFFVAAVVVGVIGLHNLFLQPNVTTKVADNPAAPFNNLSEHNQVSKNIQKTGTWDSRFRQLLVRRCAGGSEYMRLGENWNAEIGPDRFSISDTILEKDTGFLELRIKFKNLANALAIPVCSENAPIIQEMIEKNYSGVFFKDGKPTEFSQKIQTALNGPLQRIPSDKLDPNYTKTLQRDTGTVTESSYRPKH